MVPRADLDATVDALAARLAAGATQAIGRTKQLMNGSFDASAVEQLDAETEHFAASTATADFVEGGDSVPRETGPVV